MHSVPDKTYDLLIIGGGIIGVGIARDAAGRGISVALLEKNDLASATSSASSKLIHGGLRYLEHYEFRLVREALAEREVLLRNAPHIIRPLTFVLPHVKSLRPAWMIRLGLLLYDHLSSRVSLAGSHAVDLRESPLGAGLKPGPAKGFAYSDCWVDDARLVALNARAAADLGAVILTRTRCVEGARENGLWRIRVKDDGSGEERELRARALVNAAGPWAMEIKTGALKLSSPHRLLLVRGSHIVVPRLHEGANALILQNDDGRAVFVIPFEGAFSLIGTTDVAVNTIPDERATGSLGLPPAPADEIAYLCRAANRYMARETAPKDVLWSFSGVRPLLDDGKSDPAAVTREYDLELDVADGEAPALSVFGGKISVYRRLAEKALEKLGPFFPQLKPAWTATAPLPGGDIANGDFAAFVSDLLREYERLPPDCLRALARRHGTLAREILGDARKPSDLGENFGAGLCAREVDHLIEREWVQIAEDVLWRRTKTGLHMEESQREAVAAYIARRR